MWVSPPRLGPPGQWEAPTPPPSPRATSQPWRSQLPVGWRGPALAPPTAGNRGRGKSRQVHRQRACRAPPNCPYLGATALPRQQGGSRGSRPRSPSDAHVANVTVAQGPRRRERGEPGVWGWDAEGDGDSGPPDPWPWGSIPLAATLPSCLTQHHPQRRAVGSGWGCPPTAVGQQIPETSTHLQNCATTYSKGRGIAFRKPPPATSPPGSWGDGTSPLFPPPHSGTRSIILPRSPLEIHARTKVLTPSISAPRLASLAGPSPCAGGLGGHVCADASPGKTRW